MVDAVWVEVRRQLRASLRAKDFETWILPLRATTFDDGELTIEAPSDFVVEWVKDNLLGVLQDAVDTAAEMPTRLRLVVNRVLAEETAPRRRHGPIRVEERPATPTTSASVRCTFETFVVGRSNQVAYEAARAVVERPGARFNPLFLYGGVGLGKTHLLTAVAHALGQRNGTHTVACVSAETFVNEMITALRKHQMDRFRLRFRKIGTLIVDDIQFLADKVRSQEEFTHTFNALHDGRRQIVIASDRAPDDIPGIESALRSRFNSGLLADVQPLDAELRLALVRRKAADNQLDLDDEVVTYLAEHWCQNGRALEGVLMRIEAFATLRQRAASLTLVREALQAYGRPTPGRKTLGRIVAEVCRHYKLTHAEITSPKRTNRIAMPRQLAMYLCRRHTDEPLKAIGAELGRDHSTVVHALGAIEGRLKNDAELRETVSRLEQSLGS
jgi:chromosomal replication initiator protein